MDDILVLATHVDITQAVVSDGPDEGDEFIVNKKVYWVSTFLVEQRN